MTGAPRPSSISLILLAPEIVVRAHDFASTMGNLSHGKIGPFM
jgi:hypothetical protein